MFVFFHSLLESLTSLANIGSGALTARNPIHRSGIGSLGLQSMSNCLMRLEAISNPKWRKDAA